MGLWDKLKAELIDIIEWLDDSSDTIVYRFERYQNEIKNGAQLTVRESQAAVFINEGKLADVFGPGRYQLTTENLPVLATLKGWKYGFNSPFKAEIYFVNTKQFRDQKWGTPNPITLRDPDFGMVRVRAFGNYSYRVTDPAKFIREIAGTEKEFTTDEIAGQLRTMTITRFTTAIGKSGVAVLDYPSSYDQLSEFCQKQLGEEFKEYGLEITKFLIANISLPPAVEEAIDKRSSMGALGDMGKYAQMQQADAMRDAAKNPGGGGGFEGMMGMAMAQQMMNMNQNQQNNQQNNQGYGNMPQQGTPPPPPQMSQYFISVNGQQQGPFATMQLQQMKASGQFTPQTFVWKQGMAGWLAASEVGELAGIFLSATPPPPPPPM